MDLTEFLLSRIAEDEADARRAMKEAAGGPLWVVGAMDNAVGVDYDPAHVLAWCTAVRAIVAEHQHVEGCGCLHNAHGHQFGCRTCHVDQGYVLSAGWCDTLLALAQPFAGHDDFKAEWRHPD